MFSIYGLAQPCQARSRSHWFTTLHIGHVCTCTVIYCSQVLHSQHPIVIYQQCIAWCIHKNSRHSSTRSFCIYLPNVNIRKQMMCVNIVRSRQAYNPLRSFTSCLHPRCGEHSISTLRACYFTSKIQKAFRNLHFVDAKIERSRRHLNSFMNNSVIAMVIA